MDGDTGQFDVIKDNRKGAVPGVMSATLVDLATELGKYGPLFAIVSILGSYVFNTVFFHNIDGELYYQPFMSMLTFNDYISTSFQFIPPIALIFLAAIFTVQIVALLLWRPTRLAGWSAAAVNRLQGVWLLVWMLGNPKRLGYSLSILLLLVPTGYASLTAEHLQPRYNWGIAFIALTFLVLFFVRKDPKISDHAHFRRFYVYALTTITVVVMSAVMGNYRFEMALKTSQKTLRAIGPVGSRFGDMEKLTAARALEKGFFFISEDSAGKPIAYFVFYEGGFQLSNPIRSMREGPLYRRIPCWLHIDRCAPS